MFRLTVTSSGQQNNSSTFFTVNENHLSMNLTDESIAHLSFTANVCE